MKNSCFAITHLQIIFFVNRQPMAKNVASDNHIRLISVHREAIHAQKLREQRVAMALNYILQRGEYTKDVSSFHGNS